MAEMCDVKMFHTYYNRMCTAGAHMCEAESQKHSNEITNRRRLSNNKYRLNNNREKCNRVLVLRPAIALRSTEWLQLSRDRCHASPLARETASPRFVVVVVISH